jgi:PHS family inorganic phosphate transporter-like MFS transporter
MQKSTAENEGNRDGRENVLKALNDAGTTRFHFKTWLLAGMGFFTDAYDLFIIGVVLAVLPLAGWAALTTTETALIASTALIAAVIGALLFGRLLDLLGRKAVYGLELVILVAGALGSAFLTPVNGVYILIAWRFLLGIGIGGDYATSSTIMAEYSNTKKRGMLVGMVFSMQSLGLAVGPLVTLGLIFGGVPPALIWRLVLAFGAIPAAAVIYGRRKMPETPKFTVGVKGNVEKATKDLYKYTGISVKADANKRTSTLKMKWFQLFSDRKLGLILLGTAGTWFLMDWAFYGNSIMSSSMLSFLIPKSVVGIHHLVLSTEYSALIFAGAALPGYWIATFTIDRIGRKTIQVVGFAMMAITFGILGFIPQLSSMSFLADFLLLYGLSYFFIEFGPNVTTFVYPPEVFPVSVRGLGTGASAAGGKLGAFTGTVANVIILATIGEIFLMKLLSLLAVVGLAMTTLLLPEPKGIDLEEISGESRFLAKEPGEADSPSVNTSSEPPPV